MNIKKNAFTMCIFIMLILFSFSPIQASSQTMQLQRKENEPLIVSPIIEGTNEVKAITSNESDMMLDIIQKEGVPYEG